MLSTYIKLIKSFFKRVFDKSYLAINYNTCNFLHRYYRNLQFLEIKETRIIKYSQVRV